MLDVLAQLFIGFCMVAIMFLFAYMIYLVVRGPK